MGVYCNEQRHNRLCVILVLVIPIQFVPALLLPNHICQTPKRSILKSQNSEWTSDFDDYVGDRNEAYEKLDYGDDDDDDDDENNDAGTGKKSNDQLSVSNIFKSRGSRDLTAIQTRQFSLGEDIILSDFVGNMGFDEVTDWEYYYQDEDDPDERKVVQPNPFDSSKPKRTRTSSGSVVRVFRGEFIGRLGGTLSSRGLDRRILVKEFTGKLALKLARFEMLGIGKLQSDLIQRNNKNDINEVIAGQWTQTAASRSVMGRQDDTNLVELAGLLTTAPFLGIFGEVNLAELEGEMNPNDFYRALGVPPPKQGAIWVVYEYAGLNTISSYAQPAMIRRTRVPPKRNFFGALVDPDPVPSFAERSNFIVNGIMKGAIRAVANLHDSGITHRSIGRSSFILTGPSQDKREYSSIYFTKPDRLVIKLSDFGFSGLLDESAYDEEFISRARSFGLSFRTGEDSLEVTNFAMAEDLHALGFVFLGLLLSTLAELDTPSTPVPATDEDTLQRLLGEIFDKDISQFREYVEAEDVWVDLVNLLDKNDGAGWDLLETLFKAREKAVENKHSLQVITARGLLSSPFFD